MDGVQEAFDALVTAFKELPTAAKREELINSTKELIVVIEQLSEQEGIKLEYLKSGEVLDIKTSDKEDDFLEAEFVYIENAKNLVGQYLDKKI